MLKIFGYLGKHVIVRTRSAGVHAGTLENRQGKEVVLLDSRRIWYWQGVATLSQLAVDGMKNVIGCELSARVPAILLTEAIEIIPTSEGAQKSIESAPVADLDLIKTTEEK